MTTAGRGQGWTGEQLSARLAALGGTAPEVTQSAVYWITAGLRASDRPADGYWVPEGPECLTPASFDVWLAQRGLVDARRLAVSVLVVRAAFTPGGEIDTCALEYRRGAADGPYHGSPTRITFSGPARDVRFHQASPDGQLIEIAPTPDVRAPDLLTPGFPTPGLQERLGQGSEDSDAEGGPVASALAAWFGAPVLVVSARAPTVIEAMVGIARVLHLQRPGGGEMGCGILWHGPMAVVLPAAYPRFGVAPRLAPAQQAALAVVQAAERLVACETRRDDRGLAVLARRQATDEPVLIRFEGAVPRIMPYVPGLPPGMTEAQVQWVRYIETYEHLRVHDAYRDGDAGALIVVTQAADGKSWRHSVDDDGVETWRTAEAGASEPQPPGLRVEASESGNDLATPIQPPPLLPAVAPFGDLVDRRFPGAAYDIDEAARCLVQGRSTAAVFHARRIITHGLDAYAAWRGEPNPPIERGEQRWRMLLRWMRDDREPHDLHALLEDVRTAWRGATLQVGPKYTEAEARRIMLQVERFMSGLAALCDEDGVPASELDDDAARA